MSKAKEYFNKYLTPYNSIPKKGKDYNYNMLQLAQVDNILGESKNSIGTSTNIAQKYLSVYSESKDENLIAPIDILSCLSQCSIDSSKREYLVDINKEIKRYEKELSKIKKPLFMLFNSNFVENVDQEKLQLTLTTKIKNEIKSNVEVKYNGYIDYIKDLIDKTEVEEYKQFLINKVDYLEALTIVTKKAGTTKTNRRVSSKGTERTTFISNLKLEKDKELKVLLRLTEKYGNKFNIDINCSMSHITILNYMLRTREEFQEDLLSIEDIINYLPSSRIKKEKLDKISNVIRNLNNNIKIANAKEQEEKETYLEVKEVYENAQAELEKLKINDIYFNKILKEVFKDNSKVLEEDIQSLKLTVLKMLYRHNKNLLISFFK